MDFDMDETTSFYFILYICLILFTLFKKSTKEERKIEAKVGTSFVVILFQFCKETVRTVMFRSGLIMNLISKIHHPCQRIEYDLNVFWEYCIITLTLVR